jgi:Cysteine-rich secretory protein family
MSARFRLRALLALIAVGASIFAFARPAAAAGDPGYYVAAINAIRATRGLAPLSFDGQLASVAQSWSQQMAADGNISHNPNLGSQVTGWRSLGENVGTGATDASIEVAFENSPHHFENMVDPNFNLIGVAVVQDGNGTLWVTEDYKQSSGASKAAPAPAPRPAAPRPAAPRPVSHAVSAPRPASAPAPHAAPVHAAAAPVAAAPTPVATTAPAPAPTTVPVAVLGASAQRTPAGSSLPVRDPFTAANLTGLVALIALGASMAMFARVRVRAGRTTSAVAG